GQMIHAFAVDRDARQHPARSRAQKNDYMEREALQRRVVGATRQRMLREMAEALDMLTLDQGLVLSLEDLQWSDHATLELLAMLARRRERARLCVLGTYRPVDVRLGGHPLRGLQQELQMHGYCQELQLGGLPERAVQTYLTQRFAGGVHLPLQKLARILQQCTEGHPFFLIKIVESWVEQGIIRQREGRWELDGDPHKVEVPATIRQLITHQLERLSPADRQVLEVASVAGVDFSTASVAAGLEIPIEAVEKRCEGLVQREQFLQHNGIDTWPDGTMASRYRFGHAFYQEIVYGRMRGVRRVMLHRRVGERQEQDLAKRPRAS
ncbi:MAG: ATP-binding protein, partial [Longimicrobiales bacterium]